MSIRSSTSPRSKTRAFTSSSTQTSVPRPSPYPRTPTPTSGRTAWTITLRCRWITFRFAKATASGTGLRTWTMGAWHPWLGDSSTAGVSLRQPTASTKAAITLDRKSTRLSFRSGCRIWHGASHLDDGRMAPVVGGQFDGWSQPTATDGKYKGGDHIPGMNVGGWYDAGDFDLEEPSELNVIQSLALAYRQFGLKYDELTVDETAREVEMHRPDGVPDAVEQVKHGALLILAQFHNIGHAIRGTHEPDLRQYTHLGDGASKTDGRIYNPTLGPNEVKGEYSGKPDDRWIFSTTSAGNQWSAIAALAAAADVLKGWDDALAKDA